jgi:hypothetical protein
MINNVNVCIVRVYCEKLFVFLSSVLNLDFAYVAALVVICACYIADGLSTAAFSYSFV